LKLAQIVNVAYQESKKALNKNEVPVGAVVFDDKKIISKAHNLVEQNNDPLAHAEILAIKKAAKRLKTKNLKGLRIYSSLEPCIFCSYAISKYFISSIYFGLYDKSNLGVKNGIKLFSENFKGYKPQIYGGIGEEKFSKLFEYFFENLRKKN
tara:strand:- start:157 stop:612 length:456 start_codon:yes stop_codon:yes gene_type:complete